MIYSVNYFVIGNLSTQIEYRVIKTNDISPLVIYGYLFQKCLLKSDEAYFASFAVSRLNGATLILMRSASETPTAYCKCFEQKLISIRDNFPSLTDFLFKVKTNNNKRKISYIVIFLAPKCGKLRPTILTMCYL